MVCKLFTYSPKPLDQLEQILLFIAMFIGWSTKTLIYFLSIGSQHKEQEAQMCQKGFLFPFIFQQILMILLCKIGCISCCFKYMKGPTPNILNTI